MKRRNWLMAMLGGTVAGACAGQALDVLLDRFTSAARRAFDRRKDVQDADPRFKPYARPELREIQWSNFGKTIPNFPRTENVVSIYISRTEDSKEYVVEITDVDGKKATFWAVGTEIGQALPVRSISDY